MMTFMSILYFLPGRGSSLNGRLGLELRGRGYELRGRVLEGDFAKLSFPEQIDHVASDLVELDGQILLLLLTHGVRTGLYTPFS
jgi:hypothetical protein